MVSSSPVPERLVDQWLIKLRDVVPGCMEHWSSTSQDLRSLYKFTRDFSEDNDDSIKKRRFLLIMFPDLATIFADTKERTSSQQIKELAAKIADEDTSKTERDTIEANLRKFIRAGKQLRKLKDSRPSGMLIMLPTSIEQKIMSDKCPGANYLILQTKQCASPSLELNDLCDKTLRKLLDPLSPQLEKRRLEREAQATQAPQTRKRKSSKKSSGADDSAQSGSKGVGQAKDKNSQPLPTVVAETTSHPHPLANSGTGLSGTSFQYHNAGTHMDFVSKFGGTSSVLDSLTLPIPNYDPSNFDTYDHLADPRFTNIDEEFGE